MIVVPNIDSKIWDTESLILDIVDHITQNQPVEISLNAEGPCAESLGLYRMLDDICQRLGYPRQQISIYTCNQIESHPVYHIRLKPSLFVHETQKFAPQFMLFANKSFNRHFGMFIGRSNWIRLWMASAIQNQHREKTVMTYHWKPQNEFHLVHLGLDDMVRWNADTDAVRQAVEFLKQCPLTFAEQNSYPILSPEHLNICKIYDQFFLEVVCETYFSGTSFFPTEKICRPLMMKTPFVVHGPVDYLRNLSRLGFKTFDQWWSEEYDDYGHDLRVTKILRIINELSRASVTDLVSMYQDMLPVLEHNHDVFMNLRKSDFQKSFGYV